MLLLSGDLVTKTGKDARTEIGIKKWGQCSDKLTKTCSLDVLAKNLVSFCLYPEKPIKAEF